MVARLGFGWEGIIRCWIAVGVVRDSWRTGFGCMESMRKDGESGRYSVMRGGKVSSKGSRVG